MSDPQPTLTDGTVTIRPLTEADVQGVYEQCVDPLSIRWTQVPVPFSHHDARDFCLKIAPGAWADGSQAIFAVESGGAYRGNIALRDEGHGRAEVAYGAHPSGRGTGVMTAAVGLLLGWGFERRGVTTAIWRADVGNWASRRLAWRLGFGVDGVLRRSHVSRGELVDAWVGTLLADEPHEPRHPWHRPVLLEGKGLLLRPMREDDVPRIVEACSDPRTQHWLGNLPSPYTAEVAHTYLQRSQEGDAQGVSIHWSVTEPARTGEAMLASVNLFGIVPETEAEVGYWAHPDARGCGVMSRAARLVVEHAVTSLGLRRVMAGAAVDNAASRHVIEAAGMRPWGTERLGTKLRTGRADVVFYDVLAEERPALRERSSAPEASSTISPSADSPTPSSAGDR